MKKTAAVIVMMSAIVSTQAETIASYGFDDSATSSDTEMNTTAGAITTNGASVAAFGYSAVRAGGTKSALFQNASFNSVAEEGAVSARDFLTFNVSVNAGKRISFTSLSFYVLRPPVAGAGAPDSFAVRTSQDNYAADVAAGTIPAVASETDTEFILRTADLSGASNLQSVTNNIEFRIYMWCSQGIGTGPTVRTFRLDELALSGTVSDAIPGAGTVSLVMLSGLSLLLVRCIKV